MKILILTTFILTREKTRKNGICNKCIDEKVANVDSEKYTNKYIIGARKNEGMKNLKVRVLGPECN